jgi:hypothetical protein
MWREGEVKQAPYGMVAPRMPTNQAAGLVDSAVDELGEHGVCRQFSDEQSRWCREHHGLL